MKQKQKPNLSGIQIENTISMAVQNKNYHRSSLYLVLIAFLGAVGGIFTFLTMFHPEFSAPTLIGCLLVEFILCSTSAISAGKWKFIKLFFTGGYALLLYSFRHAFCDGFIHLANTIYKVIYLTDWDRFTVTGEFTEKYSTTVFLVLICFPIIFLICYAVIHFQNLFLCLIATFPYVEIGFYIGAAPNHFFAIMLFTFWVSMCAVHLSNFGTYQKKDQNSFLRRDNTFFPVSNMRFMVTEKIGILVLCIVLILSMGIEMILQITNYHRSETIKKLRANTQESFESMDFSDFENNFSFLGMNRPIGKDRVVVKLGYQEKQEYQNVPISDLTLSDLPKGRIYLKYLTGEVYDNNTWSMLPLEDYETTDVFDLFQTLDYYPPDFLYENVQLRSSETITMTMHNRNRVVSQSVPYGYEKNSELSYQHDNRFTDFSETYRVVKNQDYERILQNFSDYYDTSVSLLEYCREENREIFQRLLSESDTQILQLHFPLILGSPQFSPKTIEAQFLYEYGYKAFISQHQTALPDTEAMRKVRLAYSGLLSSYDAENATPLDTLEFLQLLRETVSSQSSYTLSPGKTPSDRDFVEYFLLDNHKGYCMHYATAGVILARMAGIPARYCEGYLVDCNENKTLKKSFVDGKSVYTMNVLDSNAHAWVEFYINGWGWIPFEFTYTQYEPIETPTMPEPTQQELVTTSVSTQTASISTDTTTVASTTLTTLPSTQNSKIDYRPIIWIFVVLLAIAAIPCIFYLFWRMAYAKRYKAFHQKDTNVAAECAYQYLLRLLRYCGVDTNSKKVSDIAEDGKEKCSKYLGEYRLEDAVYIAAKGRYSHHTITADELVLLLRITNHIARSIYQESSMTDRIKLRYFMHLC